MALKVLDKSARAYEKIKNKVKYKKMFNKAYSMETWETPKTMVHTNLNVQTREFFDTFIIDSNGMRTEVEHTEVSNVIYKIEALKNTNYTFFNKVSFIAKANTNQSITRIESEIDRLSEYKNANNVVSEAPKSVDNVLDIGDFK